MCIRDRYVVIRDKKNPKSAEIMVFADDAAKVNRVLDKMNLDLSLIHISQGIASGGSPVLSGEFFFGKICDNRKIETKHQAGYVPVKRKVSCLFA